MIRITSDYLKKGDLAFLKRFCYFVMHKLVRPSVLRKANINIRIIKNDDLESEEDAMDFKDYGAWVFYEGIDPANGKKKFSMTLNAARLNRNAKKTLYRVKRIMYDLAHELTHVKQYLNNELFDYVDGKARYKGEVFHLGHADDLETYFNSPWEIEAYGREHGFYKMFQEKLKQEQKAKSKK
jgi:hypothetical protein